MFKPNVFLLTISMLLTACGGGGGGSGAPSTGNPPVIAQPPVAASNVLFVTDRENKAIAAFDTLAPAPGSATMIGKVLTSDAGIGYGAQLDSQRDLLYTAYVNQINVHANARTLAGRVTPARTITVNIANVFLNRMVLDTANDRMYVGYQGGSVSAGFAVFDKISTLSGQVTPSRMFRGPIDIDHFAIDTKRAILYSKHIHLTSEVYVFVGIDSAQGEQAIARRIPNEGQNIVGLAVDAERDRLYAGVDTGSLFVFSEASKTNKNIRYGNILPGWRRGGVMALDTRNDRLYAGLDSTTFIVNSASTIGQPGWPMPLAVSVMAGARIEGFAFYIVSA